MIRKDMMKHKRPLEAVPAIPEGYLKVGKTPASWGFTIDRFYPDSYLWRESDRIMVSLIRAKEEGKGYFSHLVKAIEADGFKVAVPNPLSNMTAILRKWGFAPHTEISQEIGVAFEVWCRP